jgi:hypothetical protein
MNGWTVADVRALSTDEHEVLLDMIRTEAKAKP